DWLVLQVVPSLPPYQIVPLLVVVSVDVYLVPDGVLLIRHFYKDAPEMACQHTRGDKPLHLRIFHKGREDDMLPQELRPRPVEAVRQEDGDIVHPGIPGSRAQQNPVVVLRDLQEGLLPCARPHDPLLIEDEERVLNVLVGLDVVPGVDLGEQAEEPRLSLPVPGVPLLRRRDAYQPLGSLDVVVVGQGRDGLTAADRSLKDAAVA